MFRWVLAIGAGGALLIGLGKLVYDLTHYRAAMERAKEPWENEPPKEEDDF